MRLGSVVVVAVGFLGGFVCFPSGGCGVVGGGGGGGRGGGGETQVIGERKGVRQWGRDGGRSEMAIQRAVRLHQWQEKKKQLDLSITCSHSVAQGCAACTEVHCGSGSSFVCFCFFPNKRGEC